MKKPKKNHHHDLDLPTGMYGPALTEVALGEDGWFWIDNGEYQSRVEFCPVCGKRSPAVASASPVA